MIPVILGALAGYLLGRNTDGERKPAPRRDESRPAHVEGARRPTPAQREAIMAAARLERYPYGEAGWLQGGRIMERAVSAARALMNRKLIDACIEKRDRLEAEWREASDAEMEGALEDAGEVAGKGVPTHNEDKARIAAERLQAYLDAAKIRGKVEVSNTDDGLVLLAILEAPSKDDLVVVSRVEDVDGIEVRVVLPAAPKGNGKAAGAAMVSESPLVALVPATRGAAVTHSPEVEADIAAARALTAIEGLGQIGIMQKGILAALQAGDERTVDELRALETKLMAESHAASGEEAS